MNASASAPVRVITLGCGRTIRLGAYARAWRRAKAAVPGSRFERGLTSHFSVTREELLEQFRYGTDDRISSHMPGYGKGRKWSEDWQREVMQSKWRINTPRLILDWLPKDLRARFAHRLRCNMEDL